MGRGFKHVNIFVPNASKTVCDVTGFEKTTADVERRWEGWFVIPAAWHARQPQDFPVTAQKQQVYKDSRSEQSNPLETAQPPVTPI
jgi:hypothetical protein